MIRVGIVEDNNFLAESLAKKLALFEDFKLKFCAANGQDLLDKLEENANVHVLLMDIQMPEMNGIEATKEVLKKYPQIKIIMLTVLDTEQKIYEAIQAGAIGYLLKESSPKEIQNAVLEAKSGGAVLSPSVAFKAMKIIQNPEKMDQEPENFNLSSREQEVLVHLSKGLNYKQIAVNLFISPNTVRRHIENVYQKLEVHNKAEALQKAYQYKMV